MDFNLLINNGNKKRPNTIPIFGPGKWLSGSRALKVGIYQGSVALQFKVRTARWKCQQTQGSGP
ncbi:hypothetical protein F3I27_12705 [Pantoea sp. Bo_2]|nr:hypothetical protein F3I57_18960 [Pantoea sp. VH_3]KAA5948607.1 hypothetical protein F3I56_19550 [Pantoea sp. VH_25]KAA5955437.1 hypothetical protein F3I55_12745 [Pantoea sp. VH_24]KAA5958942.1 hypothetical protein F3I53_13505 [Pantoea sp. VH_16]KAA5964140.1 hypothetical protein F3I54_13345 [Pantoea sp. VH_18]KAA5981827.1 hypothetical protein F3I48_13445 [Pantoea sp. M_3]KAA5993008.1 hypothetical protein F3I46_20145 [Pantoea sp. M_1]KAA6002406.1 hypothetical protein F3I45_11870 [Pantoea s